jgi:hypothetical protein
MGAGWGCLRVRRIGIRCLAQPGRSSAGERPGDAAALVVSEPPLRRHWPLRSVCAVGVFYVCVSGVRTAGVGRLSVVRGSYTPAMRHPGAGLCAGGRLGYRALLGGPANLPTLPNLRNLSSENDRHVVAGLSKDRSLPRYASLSDPSLPAKPPGPRRCRAVSQRGRPRRRSTRTRAGVHRMRRRTSRTMHSRGPGPRSRR